MNEIGERQTFLHSFTLGIFLCVCAYACDFQVHKGFEKWKETRMKDHYTVLAKVTQSLSFTQTHFLSFSHCLCLSFGKLLSRLVTNIFNLISK